MCHHGRECCTSINQFMTGCWFLLIVLIKQSINQSTCQSRDILSIHDREMGWGMQMRVNRARRLGISIRIILLYLREEFFVETISACQFIGMKSIDWLIGWLVVRFQMFWGAETEQDVDRIGSKGIPAWAGKKLPTLSRLHQAHVGLQSGNACRGRTRKFLHKLHVLTFFDRNLSTKKGFLIYHHNFLSNLIFSLLLFSLSLSQ